MRVLVVGLGSIAKKHINALRKIIPTVSIYALRSSKSGGSVDGVLDVYSWEQIDFTPEFILISNPTSEHANTVIRASEFNCPIFLEKPALDSVDAYQKVQEKLSDFQNSIYVAYFLRFHPCLIFLKDYLGRIQKINEVTVYCGSYLPDWRPGVDFRKTYSANKEMGGGVHLDLVHELDYVSWLFGKPLNYTKSFSSNSSLNIDAIDYANYHFEYADFSLSITLNYYRINTKREIEILTNDDIITVDLFNSTIISEKQGELFKSDKKTIDLYEDQLSFYLKAIKESPEKIDTFGHSKDILKYCENE